MEPEVVIFLPFWWIAKQQPQGAWDSNELWFSSPGCLNDCSRKVVTEFSVGLDEFIAQHLEARIIGYVLAVDFTNGSTNDPLEQVLEEFRQFLRIMGKEAADALTDHAPYDMKIDLKEGETAPWGPI
jgi:hypothetical protein